MLTPPKYSRCFSLPPPTLDLFLPISIGSANRTGETVGGRHGEEDEDEDCLSRPVARAGQRRFWLLFMRTSAFSLPYCPFFLPCEICIVYGDQQHRNTSYSSTHRTLPRTASRVSGDAIMNPSVHSTRLCLLLLFHFKWTHRPLRVPGFTASLFFRHINATINTAEKTSDTFSSCWRVDSSRHRRGHLQHDFMLLLSRLEF
ncbi:hypothetical protein K438DRAFT_2049728 [Mycena galopus ATCC 62051]|nr:hypothetical protein K438DRAFT_2049728 [Mycena galopus ATCC 62051]